LLGSAASKSTRTDPSVTGRENSGGRITACLFSLGLAQLAMARRWKN
jgi:hypothetical protein